jgi:hypothetical protein
LLAAFAATMLLFAACGDGDAPASGSYAASFGLVVVY